MLLFYIKRSVINSACKLLCEWRWRAGDVPFHCPAWTVAFGRERTVYGVHRSLTWLAYPRRYSQCVQGAICLSFAETTFLIRNEFRAWPLPVSEWNASISHRWSARCSATERGERRAVGARPASRALHWDKPLPEIGDQCGNGQTVRQIVRKSCWVCDWINIGDISNDLRRPIARLARSFPNLQGGRDLSQSC